jgi:hypothetical protein
METENEVRGDVRLCCFIFVEQRRPRLVFQIWRALLLKTSVQNQSANVDET